MDTIKSVIEFLRGKGVEISDDAQVAADRRYGEQVFAPSDKVLSDGDVKLTAAFNKERTEDLQRFKEESRRLAASLREAEDSLVRGDKVSSQKLQVALAENEKLKAVSEIYMADQRTIWGSVAALHKDGKLPEAAAKFYTFPEDGGDLDDEQIIRNVAKYREHQALGIFGGGPDNGPTPPPAPRASPTGPASPQGEEWRGMPASEKLKLGHERWAKQQPPAREPEIKRGDV